MAVIHPKAAEEIIHYIAGLEPFAQAICKKLRQIILKADSDIQEDWKWGPHYSCQGMVCGFGGFARHVKFTFFNGSAMKDPLHLFNHCVDNEFSRSIKFTQLSEINEKALTGYIQESVAINKKGFKREIKNKNVEVPEDLLNALNKNKSALAFFDQLSYGYKKDYVQWVTSAKRGETRTDRIAKLVKRCSEKKKMND
jgi:uncharacterized protein YdeI (YjbR/CyaY-like superfamily)